MELLLHFLDNTGFALADYRHLIMIAAGLLFIYLAIVKHYEPLLLIPIGFGTLVDHQCSVCGAAKQLVRL